MSAIEQADKVLAIYIKRGEEAIKFLMSNNVAMAMHFLDLRETAFKNLRLVEKNFGSELQGWQQQPLTSQKLQKISEQNRQLYFLLNGQKKQLGDNLKIITHHKKIKQYVSHAGSSNKFIKQA